MEDGLDLLRAWLRADVGPSDPGAWATAGIPSQAGGRTLESAFASSLARALAFGARDVDVRVAPDAACGRFTEVTLEDTAPGLSLTALRAWLSTGAPPRDPGHDRTLPGFSPPFGPPGFALSRFRTSAAGQTVEAWVLPDGTWELHLHTGRATGNRETWYFHNPDPGETLERLRVALAAARAGGPLRVWLQGTPCDPGPTPAGSRFHVERADAAVRCRLDLLDRPDGALVLAHRGFVFHRGPGPAPYLNFLWDSAFGPEVGDPGTAAGADLRELRRELGERLLNRLIDDPATADDWRRFLAGHPDPGWRAREVGRDLRGVFFTIPDLREKVVLPAGTTAPGDPTGADFLALDRTRWTPEVVRMLTGPTAAKSRRGDGRLAARRVTLPAGHPCAAWPRLWEKEAARDPRLACSSGLVTAEIHEPSTAAWPFFPVDGAVGLARLRALPPPPWGREGALWVAVNHPLVVRLAARLAPGDAVRLLGALVLLAQDLEPDLP